MAHDPTHPHPVGKTPASKETTFAILGALVLALVLGTLMTGNPFRALRLAYLDYAGTPAAGLPAASDVKAPANATQAPTTPVTPK